MQLYKGKWFRDVLYIDVNEQETLQGLCITLTRIDLSRSRYFWELKIYIFSVSLCFAYNQIAITVYEKLIRQYSSLSHRWQNICMGKVELEM
jgi:hypothetical protein